MNKVFVMVVIAFGLNACTQQTVIEPIKTQAPVQVAPQDIITSTGVTIRTYDEPEIIRQSLPQP
jgi:hypothetical protein